MDVVALNDEDTMNINEHKPEITDMVSFICLTVLYIYTMLIYTIIGRNGHCHPQ